jgi:integrase
MRHIEQIYTLVKKTAADDSFAGIRDAATISIIIAASLSASDIASLCLKDLNFYPKAVIVKQKSKSRRILPVSDVLDSSVMKYLKKLKKLGISCDAKFYFDAEETKSTTDRIRKMLKLRCQEAGVPVYTPTQLRQIGLVQALKNARTLNEALAIMVNSGYVFVSSVANKFGLEDFEKLDPILSEFSDRIKGKRC